MKYFVKTRNWYSNKIVLKLLNVTKIFGVQREDGYTDGDGKFGLSTDNVIKAVFVLFYFLILQKWSGGWTYILDENSSVDGNYKIFYLK